MKVEVLVSCMRQRDYKLIEDENLLNTTALFVNQTESVRCKTLEALTKTHRR